MLAHLSHAVGKCADGGDDVVALELTQHVVAVADRLDRVQRPVEERGELVLLAAVGERGEDLVEVQITEEGGRPVGRGSVGARLAVKEDAGEGHHAFSFDCGVARVRADAATSMSPAGRPSTGAGRRRSHTIRPHEAR